MQRRAGRIVLAVTAVVMLLVTVYYAADRYIKSPFIKKDAAVKTEVNEDVAAEEGQGAQEAESIPFSRRFGHALPYEGNLEKIGEPFLVEDNWEDNQILDFHMEMCVNEARITKERVDTDALYYEDTYPVEVDEEKNILNNYNYVVVNITLRNLRETEDDIYVNSFRFYTYDPQTEDLADLAELRGYKTLEDPLEYNKSYARVVLPSGGEYTCNLVYLVTDESLEEKIPYLYYTHTGLDVPHDERARYIRLDQ